MLFRVRALSTRGMKYQRMTNMDGTESRRPGAGTALRDSSTLLGAASHHVKQVAPYRTQMDLDVRTNPAHVLYDHRLERTCGS